MLSDGHISFSSQQVETPAAVSWRDILSTHFAVGLFPPMSPGELKALAEDIKRNGQQQPIAIIEKPRRRPDGTLHVGDPPLHEVLDGVSRLDAMESVGIEVIGKDGQLLNHIKRVVIDTNEVDPISFVISANLARRHLSAEQRRELIAKLIKATPEKSDRQIAETAKASPTTVGTVRAEMESTVQIGQLPKRIGKDGKVRKQPAQKKTAPAKPKRSTSQDQRELEVKQAHIDELEAAREYDKDLAEQLHLAEIKIVGLESEIEELKAENAELRAKLEAAQGAAAASSKVATADTVTTGDPGPIPDFLQCKPAVADASKSSGGVTLQSAVTDVFNELVEELGGECREVVDSAPEGLSQTQRIQTLDETANVLEALREPDVSAELAGIRVTLPKPRRLRSRGDRRDAALGIIAACTEALGAIDENDPRHKEARALRDALEDASAEAEDCEFPGWRG